MSDQTLYSTQAAGDWLAEAIPGKDSKYWQGVLIANRRNDRPQVHKIPFTTIGRGAFYTHQALQEFAEFEKVRRLGQMKLTGRAAEVMQAFGIGSPDGSTTGRRLEVTEVSGQYDETTQTAFVRLAVQNPLRIYRLEPTEAKALIEQLKDALTDSEHFQNIINDEPRNEAQYQTIIDTPDVTVRRRIEK